MYRDHFSIPYGSALLSRLIPYRNVVSTRLPFDFEIRSEKMGPHSDFNCQLNESHQVMSCKISELTGTSDLLVGI